MSANPTKGMMKVQGRDYLPVARRVNWFREEHPDWGIVTAPVEINIEQRYAIYSATILNEEGRIMATGTKMETEKGFPDFVEKAETGSVGRALGYLGYGTLAAFENEAEAVRIVDGPVDGYAPESVPTVSRGFRPAPEPRPSPMTRDSAEVCNGCGAKLEIAVLRYSKDKFGEPLCRDCQRKRLDAGETGYTRNQPLPPEPPANDEYDHDNSDLSDPFGEGALMDVAPVAPVSVPGADERGRGRATR